MRYLVVLFLLIGFRWVDPCPDTPPFESLCELPPLPIEVQRDDYPILIPMPSEPGV